MAEGFCTGPALFYFDFGTGPTFFGTTEGEPDIVWTPEWEPVPNQLAGSRLPLDRNFQGEEALISGVFTRYNETLLQPLMKRTTRAVGTGNVRGKEGAGALGAFLGQEGLAFACIVVFPYFSKPIFQKAGMAPGYRFFQCFNEGDRYPPGGTKAQRYHLRLHAARRFNIAAIGGYDLYDNIITGLPAPN